jgi:hypothetical protein
MEHGNGRKLMDAFYAKYNMKSFSAGNTGTQMGGWYRKEIKSVADLKGLKMRMGGGLFGEAMAKLGVVAQNMPAGDVYSALEKGTLDATEFVGPYDDEKLGFNKVRPFYYYPGWWEGGAELEFFVNTKAYDALSAEFKAIVDAACDVAARDMTAKYDAVNPDGAEAPGGRQDAAEAVPEGRHGRRLQGVDGSLRDHEAKSPEFRKIHQDMRAFQRDQLLWTRFSEYRFDNYMSTVKRRADRRPQAAGGFFMRAARSAGFRQYVGPSHGTRHPPHHRPSPPRWARAARSASSPPAAAAGRWSLPPARRRGDRPCHALASWRDTRLASELAEIGVMLLMFGVGLHISLVRPAGGCARWRCPGQWSRSWPRGARFRPRPLVGLVAIAGQRWSSGLALSVASTVCCLRRAGKAWGCWNPSTAGIAWAGWWWRTWRWCCAGAASRRWRRC